MEKVLLTRLGQKSAEQTDESRTPTALTASVAIWGKLTHFTTLNHKNRE